MNQMRVKSAFLVALALVAAAFLVSALLFNLNRGFGAGHGRYDLAIGILASPWIFIWPIWVWQMGDFAAVVVAPFVMNLVVTALVRLILRNKHTVVVISAH